MISIAIATFNGEKYLREQLVSIYAQTFREFEVIVTDDCSTDGTLSILKEFEQKYCLKYLKNETKLGFVKNFERAISLCNFEYIALADQDDVWLPNKIETLYEEMVKCEALHPGGPIIIHHDVYLVDRSLYNRGIRYINKKGYISGLKNFLFGNPKVQGASSMFNRKLIEICFPLPINAPLHDLYLSYVCECFGTRRYISAPLMLYRQHDNNQIGVISFSIFERLKRIFNNKIVLADENEIRTITVFEREFRIKLNNLDKDMIKDYFLILGNEISVTTKIGKIFKNGFNCDGSMLKLIFKIILVFVSPKCSPI